MKDRDSQRLTVSLFDGYVVKGFGPHNTAKKVAQAEQGDRAQVEGEVREVRAAREQEGLVLTETMEGRVSWLSDALLRPRLDPDAFARTVSSPGKATKKKYNGSATWQTSRLK